MFESLKLSDLARRRGEALRDPTNTRPALWVIEEEGVRAVVKDYSNNGLLYRNTIGRFLVWRECKAYRKLRGLRGVPTLYRVINGVALVIEEISGRSVEGLEHEQKLPEEFFRKLNALLRRVHEQGLAHCDLKRAPNVLLGCDGRPYVVDWSASLSKSEFRFFPLNRVYKRFVNDDLNAIIKMQLRHCPDSVTADQKRLYDQKSKAESLIRDLRDRLRTLLQRLA